MSEFAFAIIVLNIFRQARKVVKGPDDMVSGFFNAIGVPATTFINDINLRAIHIEIALMELYPGVWPNEAKLFRALRSPTDMQEASRGSQAYGMVWGCATLSTVKYIKWTDSEIWMLLSLAYFHNSGRNDDWESSVFDDKLAEFLAEYRNENVIFCRSVIGKLRSQFADEILH